MCRVHYSFSVVFWCMWSTGESAEQAFLGGHQSLGYMQATPTYIVLLPPFLWSVSTGGALPPSLAGSTLERERSALVSHLSIYRFLENIHPQTKFFMASYGLLYLLGSSSDIYCMFLFLHCDNKLVLQLPCISFR